jgi:two-component system, chemotaxis family, sensor kinase Cph1
MGLLVAEVLRGLAQDIGQRSIDWRIGDLAPAHADPVMLRLVLENLLANAIKYTRTRSRAVVEIGSWSDDGQSTYFVRDNGVGFDMAYASKLFGVFQRLHRMEEFEGTGIGLANVRRIVERHGGRVWAEAALDNGATFFFSLPNATQAG